MIHSSPGVDIGEHIQDHLVCHCSPRLETLRLQRDGDVQAKKGRSAGKNCSCFIVRGSLVGELENSLASVPVEFARKAGPHWVFASNIGRSDAMSGD
jgi:hypothetical protein